MEAGRKTSNGKCCCIRCCGSGQEPEPQCDDYVERRELRLEDKSSMKRRFFIRMKGNVEEKIEDIRYSFGDVEIVKVDGLDGEFGFVTPIMMEGDYDTRAKSYEDQILHMIRIED